MAPKFKIESQGDELDEASGRMPSKRTIDDNDHPESPPAYQPPSKRPTRTPLNFSIESIMQPSRQQASHNNNNNNNTSHQDKKSVANVSRSPSPDSDVDSSEAESSASTLASRVSENGNHDASPQKRRVQHQQRHNNLNDLHLNLNNLVNNNDEESLVSSNSSRNSSRVSSPISPGCNLNAGGQQQQHDHHRQHHHHVNHHHHHQNNRSTHLKHSSSQHRHHHNHHEHHHGHQQRSSLPNGASPLQPADSPPLFISHSSSRHHSQQASTSSSAAYAGANQSTTGPSSGSASGSTGRLNQVECVLDNKDMWDKFHSLNTEMIITKTGRRMFPVLKVQFHNLDPSARYAVSMDIVPVDNKRYRYAYHKSCWQVAGKADPSAEPRLYPHPDSPFNGDLLSRQVISFEKVKLTNNEMDKSGHIILNSMHKYQPRVHLIELKSTLVVPPPQQQVQQINPLNGKLGSSRYQQQQQQRSSCQPQPQLDIEGYRTFVFPETVFTAVTAYQNQLITKMKIDKNPFAKGFRDSSRLSDLDRNDPFEGFMSLGPAAAAAAAACAVGRFPGGPQGPGGTGPGGMPPGSLEAAAAAAGMQPGNPGQMDQAYAQLLASAAAANSPWYSAAAAAAAANASPFGPIGPSAAAACSTAQAAQQLQATQMWLAAFSACLNNGGQQLSQLPPPPGGPMPTHDQLDSSGQLQDCRGDSRSSG